MALASRQYYYDEYQGESSYRTPPLNVARLVEERNGDASYQNYGRYAAEAIPAEPIIKPYLVPNPPKKSPQRKRSGAGANARRFRYAYISPKEKAFIFMVMIVCFAVFMASILLQSYRASMQNEVNVTKAQAASVQEDIDALKVAIEKGNAIDVIENQAMTELGMEYPGAKQIVYLDDVSEAAVDEE